jgi:hypothetical protein
MQPDPIGPLRLLLRAAVDLEIERASGDWLLVTDLFLLDTGASLVTVGADWATAHGLPFSPQVVHFRSRTAAGPVDRLVHDGELRVRFPKLPECEFLLACIFSEGYHAQSPPLLGLHNFLDYWRFTVDGRAQPPDALMGSIRFEFL